MVDVILLLRERLAVLLEFDEEFWLKLEDDEDEKIGRFQTTRFTPLFDITEPPILCMRFSSTGSSGL